MRKYTPITSSNALAYFLFEQMRIRWQVSPRPILTMQKVTRVFPKCEYGVPVWLWIITIFIADEADQPFSGRTMTEYHRSDTKPDDDALINLFTEYSLIARDIWDTRHARCYGYLTWKVHYDDSSLKNDQEGMAIYKSQKATVLAVRALLGAEGFRQLIRAEL